MSEEMSLAEELKSHLQEANEEVKDGPEINEPEEKIETEIEVKAETEVKAEPETKTDTEEKTEQTQQTPQDMRPPATWSATAKAEFSKLSPVVRGEIAKREADFSRGIQQYAEKAKTADAYIAEFQPYDQMFKSLNASPQQFLKDSLATEYRLRTSSPQEKTQLLMQYAKHYGADLSIIPQMLGLQNQPSADGQPDIQELVRQSVQQIVNPLQQKVQTWEQQSQQATQRQQQELKQFAALLPPQALVLDAGAGECKHRQYFQAQRYFPVDLAVGDDTWASHRLR